MKRFTYLTQLLVIAFLGFNIISCSTEDDNGPSKGPEAPEDNLPEEAKAFLGYWENQGNKGGNFVFFEDGICWMTPLSSSSSNKYSHISGYWTYDNLTQILATTTNEWQWQVTLSNSEAWAGVSLGSSTVQTFEKEKDPLILLKIILWSSSWKESADSTLNINYYQSFTTSSDDKYTSDFSGFNIDQTINLGTARYLEVLEDETENDYTFKYNLREYSYLGSGGNSFTGYWTRYSTKVIGSGKVTLNNPLNSTKSELVFTGFINKTMQRITTQD
jgi:hypothetical protein